MPISTHETTCSFVENMHDRKEKSMLENIKGFLFTVRWHWKNRNWKPTRQKLKAFNRDYNRYMYGKR